MIQTDKLLHFLVGFFITTVAATFLPLWIAFGIGVLCGMGKEVYDKLSYGKFDYVDLVCTIAGSFMSGWLFLIINNR